MSRRPTPTVCGEPGCPTLVHGQRCPAHQTPSSARNGSTRAWRHVRSAVLVRDGHLCQLRLPGCTIHATHVDHVIALAHGGTDEPHNLQASCPHCNTVKGGRGMTPNHRLPRTALACPNCEYASQDREGGV